MPCVLQLHLRGNLGPYVMHISSRYQCTGNAIFGPVVCVSTMLMYHSHSDGTGKMHALNAHTYKTLFTNLVTYLSEMAHLFGH